MRRVNHLIKNDYGEHNHLVSTIADAAQHMAGQKILCKLDCSHLACHCIPMADEQSVQLLSFSFCSGIFAFLRLTQGLNSSLSAFTSIVREHLDLLVKRTGVLSKLMTFELQHTPPEELNKNLELVFQRLDKTGLKFSVEKCDNGQKETELLCKTISSTGIVFIEKRVTDF